MYTCTALKGQLKWRNTKKKEQEKLSLGNLKNEITEKQNRNQLYAQEMDAAARGMRVGNDSQPEPIF